MRTFGLRRDNPALCPVIRGAARGSFSGGVEKLAKAGSEPLAGFHQAEVHQLLAVPFKNDSVAPAEIVDGKAIKIDVPVKIVGNAPGVQKGGKMVQKLRKVTLKGLAENIPDFVEADINEGFHPILQKYLVKRSKMKVG